jgi:ribosomal protein S18 acetylase RimI-like enzyme
MPPTIRRAVPDDAAAIAAIMAAVWPDQTADPAHIASVIAEPDHAALVAAVGETIAGFVDGFLMLGPDGSRRWEVDLLAVHPDHHRQGLGRMLTAQCTAAGRSFGAGLARALIHVENTASQRTFARCGYALQPDTCRLLIRTTGVDDAAPVPPAAHLIPVLTLGYRGLWIEGRRSAAAFRAANAIRSRHGWDSAGAVVPLADQAALDAAAAAEFMPVGDYAWWHIGI